MKGKAQMFDDNINNRVASIQRKQELARSREINCVYCPYHRNENASRHPKHGHRKLNKNRF